MKIAIPGLGTHDIEHAVLDMNGTLAVDGMVVDGVAERLDLLKDLVHVVVLTADTHGGAARLKNALGIETVIIEPGREVEQKARFVRDLGADRAVAIGNGSNDVLMLEESAIGICVLGAEGASVPAMLAADVVCKDVCEALDLLLKPQRLTATLRA
ncbi:MAG: HAD family hydrolase [Thermoleophilia bacterium]|nr:HAD family hydrolase [Thermoleophilia bacterium]